MSNEIPKKKLPITGYDGEQIIDTEGIVWEYNAEDHTWVYKGIIAEPDVVTPEAAGIITSATYQKLLLIQDLMKKGIDFSQFKLVGDSVNPYFYFFYSPDDFINFIPEAKNRLRIELDRNALYAKLVRNCCPGHKGVEGEKGLSGKDGLPAPNESTYTPTIEGNNYFIDVDVSSPIDTPISLRILDAGGAELVDIRLPLSGTEGPTIEVKNEEIEINEDKTDLVYVGGNLSGVVVFSSGIEFADKYKARQAGRIGESGDDGSPFLVVEEQIFDDPAIRSQNAILSMRKSVQDGVAYYKSTLYDQICAHNLALLSGDIPMGGILDSKFLAVLPSPNSCKEVCYFQFDTCSISALPSTSIQSLLECDIAPDIVVKDLDLSEWTPTDSCIDLARCDQLQFDWHKIANDPYPWKILDDPCPPEQCCFAEGSLIHTEEGLIPIEKTVVGTKVLCPDNKFRPTEKFFDNGMKECVRLTFSDGSEVTCTLDHKFPVGGQIIEAQDLQPFDQIHKSRGVFEWLKSERLGSSDDFERGYMVGFLLGDGYISNKSIGIVAPEYEEEGFNRVYEILAKKFGRNKIQRKTQENYEMLSVRWASKEAMGYFHDRGWYKNNKERRIDIPGSFYRETYKFYQGFFSALVNTDGCVSAEGSINVDSSVVKDLPMACKKVLDYLGISSCLKKHKRPKSRFGGDYEIYRLDIHRGSCVKFYELIKDGLMERKRKNVKLFEEREYEPFILPPLEYDPRSSEDYAKGLMVGAFTYHGGHNRQTRRAWVSKSMPIILREELNLRAGLNIPEDLTRKFYKNTDIPEDSVDSYDFVIGFLRSAVFGKYNLAVDKSFTINRNDVGEANLTSKCLKKLWIKHEIKEVSTPFGKTQYRIKIKSNHHIYKLFMMSYHREAIEMLGIGRPHAGSGIIKIKKKEYVGKKHTYNCTISPHHILAVNGGNFLNCQQDFFYCPNIGDVPCGIDGEITPPKRKLRPNCPCPCPKETEDDLLADGVEFPLLDASKKMGYFSIPEHPEVGHDDENLWVRECNVTNIRESEISRDRRQAPDLYKQPVKVNIPIPGVPTVNPFAALDFSYVPSKVTITIGLLNPDHECPDTPSKPGYLDPCPFHNIIIAEPEGNVFIWPSKTQEIQITEEKEVGRVEFWVAGTGTIDFNCWVNTTELFCCRTYFIWTRVEPLIGPPVDEDDPFPPDPHLGTNIINKKNLGMRLGGTCDPVTVPMDFRSRVEENPWACPFVPE